MYTSKSTTHRDRLLVVCPILPQPPVTGGAKRTLRLLEAAERAGTTPHIVTDDAGAPGAAEALRARGWGVDVVAASAPSTRARLEMHTRRRPSPYLPAIAARLRELRYEGAALAQVEHTQSAYYHSTLAGLPTCLSLQNVDSQIALGVAQAQRPGTLAWVAAMNRWQAMGVTERRAVRCADAVLAVSPEDAEYLSALSSNVLLVPNGVDDAPFAVDPMAPRGDAVLFFGALDYAPNELGLLRFLQDGWPTTRRARPAAVLRIAGPGASAQLVAAARRTAGVELLGVVGDIAAEIGRARATVVPVWAGGGTRLKVLEALAAARPVVSTPLGAAGIGFVDGVHGVLAERPAALGAALARLLSDERRSRELAARGRELADAFRWPALTGPLEDLYRGWLRGVPRPPDALRTRRRRASLRRRAPIAARRSPRGRSGSWRPPARAGSPAGPPAPRSDAPSRP